MVTFYLFLTLKSPALKAGQSLRLIAMESNDKFFSSLLTLWMKQLLRFSFWTKYLNCLSLLFLTNQSLPLVQSLSNRGRSFSLSLVRSDKTPES